MTCEHCGASVSGRRDRLYCSPSCRRHAFKSRRNSGAGPPQRWQHPSLSSDNAALHAAAAQAAQIGETHGWARPMLLRVFDGLTVVLQDGPLGQAVPLTAVQAQTGGQGCSRRVAEVLAAMKLLEDDTAPAIRSWIEQRTTQLPSGFAADVRAWLLVLADGDSRTRPRSPTTLYVYLGAVKPLLHIWAPTRGHLREITVADVTAALDPQRAWARSSAVTALRSLFRFATKRGLVFADPTIRLANPGGDRHLLPLTDTQIRAIEADVVTPAQRLVVALAAVHAASGTTIRHLTLDHVDLPNRRITLEGIAQPLGPLTHHALRGWLEHRRSTWPHTPNRHLLISRSSAHGASPVGHTYLNDCLPAGVKLDRIRADRMLHEALTTGADPLRLTVMFNLAHTTASRYAAFAQQLLNDQLEQGAGEH